MSSFEISTIQDRARVLLASLPGSVRLIAVSKYMPSERIRAAYAAGVRDFGESRVQEAIRKMTELEDLTDITWHLIGHLQSNKAKLAVRYFDWIHSVDSLALAQRLNRIVEVEKTSPQLCLQVKVRPDPNKFGWSISALKSEWPLIQACQHLKWRGIMTILPLGLTQPEIKAAFRQTQCLATELSSIPPEVSPLKELSMGMSNDYLLAIESGATMIRIGRRIFGDRPEPEDT
ncbi:YggS family pyridoxal phosphate-dependent enzyme [Acaryochloris sp. IP29b_bin.137]|uniref:YggS family pyridoxal phosphate-dependent enzyme n=1 Tax=Acaryochloris sp. IP29b_bin.137 TaxID=2969217 RepID=UPI002603F99D|nr:YggS family pyridoxal phosphate-dependent enzyme [Acaryochloris sp. IP29b_bin.137]